MGRVLGQGLVAFFHVDFLPPMDAWYSGLIPYPMLLSIQIAILAVQARVSRDLWRSSGYFAVRRPRAGGWLCRFSYLYFAVILARFFLTSTHRIPIFFHWVLAAYVFLLGRVFARPPEPAAQRP